MILLFYKFISFPKILYFLTSIDPKATFNGAFHFLMIGFKPVAVLKTGEISYSRAIYGFITASYHTPVNACSVSSLPWHTNGHIRIHWGFSQNRVPVTASALFHPFSYLSFQHQMACHLVFNRSRPRYCKQTVEIMLLLSAMSRVIILRLHHKHMSVVADCNDRVTLFSDCICVLPSGDW